LLLATEDVGSLPVLDDFDESRANFNRTVVDKVSIGLDYPCCPQLTGTSSKPMNMGLQFLLPLSKLNLGIEVKGEDVHILSDEVKETSVPIGTERAEYYLRFLREQGLISKVKGAKACVTGPFTLASYIDRKNLMTCGASKPNIVTALAKILSRSCRRLGDLGFDLVNIDEPFLSVMLGRTVLFKYDQKFVVETLNMLIKEASCLSAIHVCGRITPLVKAVLLESEVDIVDHEFAGSPSNLSAYSREELEKAGKFLAYGCVSSVSPRVETVEEIVGSLNSAMKTFGPRVIVKPDCGFAGMLGIPDAYGIAFGKLKNMVEAARLVAKSSISGKTP